MATQPAPSLLDPTIHAARWIADYCAREQKGDVLCATPKEPAWSAMFEEIAAVAGDASADAARIDAPKVDGGADAGGTGAPPPAVTRRGC